jgi:hypothetical protein
MNKVVGTVSSLAMASSLLMGGGDIAPVEPVMPEVVVHDSWNYTASIYLWGAAIGGTTGDGQEVDIPFSTIVILWIQISGTLTFWRVHVTYI